jgi:hypothetical protein
VTDDFDERLGGLLNAVSDRADYPTADQMIATLTRARTRRRRAHTAVAVATGAVIAVGVLFAVDAVRGGGSTPAQVTVDCPISSHMFPMWPASGPRDGDLVPFSPTSGALCEYGDRGTPDHPVEYVFRKITLSSQQALDVAGMLNALPPPLQFEPGRRVCPDNYGPQLIIVLAGPDHTPAAIRAEPYGCGDVGDGVHVRSLSRELDAWIRSMR